VICGNSDHQERVENYLENNLERLYVTSEITPEQEPFSFGKPRISGGDLRSVAASYVSALTDLPELNSEDEQSTAGMHRAPKRIKGRSIMVEASSEKIYAGKPRGDWASKVKAAGGTTATTTTIGTMGTQSHDTNKVLGTASISSAGQSTLTAQTTQTKQEIALANRMESYKRETEKQIKELKESVAMLQQKLVDTEERMDQQADILGNIMEQNTLTKDKLDMVEKNNDIRHSKLDNNMELMLAHWGITARSDSSNRTPESSPARKRKTKRKTPVRRSPVEEKQMDISMENNRFGALTEDEEGSSSDDDDMMASEDDGEDEVATFIGGDDSDASHADE
jgi:hypothetical protein